MMNSGFYNRRVIMSEGHSLPFASTGPQGHRERMRDRLLTAGPDGLADYELLEMLLFLGIARRDTKPLAKAMINAFGSLSGVVGAPSEALTAAGGLGTEALTAIRLVEEAGARLVRAEAASRPVLSDWAQLMAYVERPADARTEQRRVLFLDNRNRLLADEAQADGPAWSDVRSLLERALALHATALILLHDRPDVEPEPDVDALAFTRRLRESGATLSITMHDHLLLGREDWVSFTRHGYL